MRKNIFRNIAFWHIVGVIIIVVIIFVCWKCGFRITYSPNIEYNWDAIGAVANWFGAIVGAIVIPLVVVLLQHKWDKDKQDIADSNSATLTEVKRTQEILEAKQKEIESICDALLVANLESNSYHNIASGFKPRSKQDDILQYIKVAMYPTTKDIANYLDIPIETLIPILKDMKERRIIGTKYIRDDISAIDCKWKLLNK